MILLAIGGLSAYAIKLHHELTIITKIPFSHVIVYGLLPIISFLMAGYLILKLVRFGW
jgi:TRAP-type C4-dicarboxylate transport system permease small subunit